MDAIILSPISYDISSTVNTTISVDDWIETIDSDYDHQSDTNDLSIASSMDSADWNFPTDYYDENHPLQDFNLAQYLYQPMKFWTNEINNQIIEERPHFFYEDSSSDDDEDNGSSDDEDNGSSDDDETEPQTSRIENARPMTYNQLRERLGNFNARPLPQVFNNTPFSSTSSERDERVIFDDSTSDE